MSYIGRGLQSGAFRQLDDISSGFDGSDTTHTMQVNSTNVTVGDVNQILLSLGGVIQKPGTDFTVSSSVLTFTTAPAANTSFFAILLGSDNGGTVTPTDGSVTTAKLADTSVTTAKLSGNLVTPGTLDVNGQELILDADADTSITADTDDTIHIKTGGTDRVTITDGNFCIGTSTPIMSGYDANSTKLCIHDGSGSAQSGYLELSSVANTNGYNAGAIQFANNANSDATNLDADSKTVAQIRSTIITTDSNAGDDSGGVLEFWTKAENATINKTFELKEGNAITAQVFSSATTDTTAGFQIDKQDESSSASSRMIGLIVGGQGRGFILNGDSDSDAPNFGAGSDRRLKKNITAYTGGYDKIKSIPVQTWDEQFTDAKGIKGWIADELETVFPDAVTGTKDGTRTVTNAIISQYGNCLREDITEEEFNELKAKGKYANCTWSESKSVPDYQLSMHGKLFPDVVQALQAAITKIETLEADVKTLKGE